MIREWNSCEELSKKFDISLNCCDSCHDDFESGYSDMCCKIIDDVSFDICCRMSQSYDEKFKVTLNDN